MLPFVALVKRELLTSLRRTRAFVFLCVCVCAVAWPVILVWASMPSQVNVNYFRSGSTSSDMVGLAAYALLLACGLFVPALASTGIVEERIRGTLDQLELSFVKPFGIVAAKMVNAAGFLVILAIGTLPFVATAFFLVGVEWKVVVQAYVLVLASCISCAAVGVLASTYFRRTSTAIAAGYTCAWALLGIPSLVAILIYEAWVPRTAPMGDFFYIVTFTSAPIVVLERVMSGRLTWGLFSLPLAWSAIVVGASMILTMQILSTRRHDEALVPRPHRFAYGVLAAAERVWRALRARPARPMPDGWNPVLIRESRHGGLRSWKALLAIAVAAFAMYALFFLVVFKARIIPLPGFDVRTRAQLWMMLQMAVAIGAPPLFAAHVMARERDTGSLDLLRTTLLRPRDVFHGKAASALLPVLALVTASMLVIAGYWFLGTSRSAGLPASPFRADQHLVFCSEMIVGGVTIVVCAMVSLCLALFASACMKRGTTALVVALVLIVTVFVLSVAIPYATLSTLWWDRFTGGRGREFERAVEAGCAFFSPPAAYFETCVRRGFTLPELMARGLMARITVYWAGNIALFSAFGLVMYLAAMRLFTKRFDDG